MASLVHRFESARGGRSWRVSSFVAAIVLLQVVAGVLFFGTRSSLAWFGTGSCPMPGGFVSGQKCLAVDSNGVEVPWRGEIILPAGTKSISDHAFFNGTNALAGNYELQLVEDNGTCCTVYQTIDYVVSSAGVTTPATSAINDAALTEAFSHHAVGSGGLLGYFLYVNNATVLPSGATCQNTVTFLDANGASLGSGTSGSGETCNPPSTIPGTPPPPTTGSLSAHIYDCTGNVAGNTDVTGGQVSATGPTAIPAQANPLMPTTVSAGQYVVGAVAPANFHLVDCNGVTAVTPKTVSVPANGTQNVVFYVTHDAPPPPTTGTLSAHIYDCTANVVGTTDVAGGHVSATGPTAIASQANPLAPTSVLAGDYLVGAVAPANFHLVDCNGVTSSTPKAAHVPAGGSQDVVFYVTHDTGDLAGHIYDCESAATTTEVPGGTLAAAGVTSAPVANPMTPVTVASGTYPVTATSPAGYHLVACGANATDTNIESIVVPANAHGVAVFYVRKDMGALAGHIFDCETTATRNEVPGGTLAAAGVTAKAVANPMHPVKVTPGTYTVAATAPAGYHFVACGDKTDSKTQSVTVPVNGLGVARFYVRKNPVVTPTPTPGGGGQGAGTPPPSGGTQGVSTGNPVSQVLAAVGGVKGASITQPNTGRVELLRDAIISLVLLVAGAVMLFTNRRREARI